MFGFISIKSHISGVGDRSLLWLILSDIIEEQFVELTCFQCLIEKGYI